MCPWGKESIVPAIRHGCRAKPLLDNPILLSCALSCRLLINCRKWHLHRRKVHAVPSVQLQLSMCFNIKFCYFAELFSWHNQICLVVVYRPFTSEVINQIQSTPWPMYHRHMLWPTCWLTVDQQTLTVMSLKIIFLISVLILVLASC